MVYGGEKLQQLDNSRLKTKFNSTWSHGYKTVMFNTTEHEISTAHKTKTPTNEDVSCFKSTRCCIYHANTYKPSVQFVGRRHSVDAASD